MSDPRLARGPSLTHARYTPRICALVHAHSLDDLVVAVGNGGSARLISYRQLDSGGYQAVAPNPFESLVAVHATPAFIGQVLVRGKWEWAWVRGGVGKANTRGGIHALLVVHPTYAPIGQDLMVGVIPDLPILPDDGILYLKRAAGTAFAYTGSELPYLPWVEAALSANRDPHVA